VARAATLACACAALSLAAGAAGIETTCPGLRSGPTHTVTRVLDPETVVLDDGRELRLIGTLAPRAIDADAEPGTWPAETAASEALRALVLGKSIALGFAGERADRYGRIQAHAFLVAGEERRWVQRELIESGFARAYALAGNRACAKELLAAEQAAREARRGLWAEAAYQVRSAHEPAELLRYRATFQLIEGRIVRVGGSRGTVYLNFDRNWRRGFSVSLRRDDSSLLDTHSGNPRGLEGRSVRIRGWIGQRGRAPVIDLSSGGLLEVLGGSGDAQPGEPR
jgi:endonuclease YncB( thermonuclease family)